MTMTLYRETARDFAVKTEVNCRNYKAVNAAKTNIIQDASVESILISSGRERREEGKGFCRGTIGRSETDFISGWDSAYNFARERLFS